MISFGLSCKSQAYNGVQWSVYELLMRGWGDGVDISVWASQRISSGQPLRCIVGKPMSSWEGQILTLGLLRGLVDRPEDAPLIDRDLHKKNTVRSKQTQTHTRTKNCIIHWVKNTTQQHTHNRNTQNPQTSLCSWFRNPAGLNFEQIKGYLISEREESLKRGQRKRIFLCCLQFSLLSLCPSAEHPSLFLLALNTLTETLTDCIAHKVL